MAHLLLEILSLLLLSVSLAFIQSDPIFTTTSPHLFWVAANKTQCSNYSNGSDCDTLDGYLGREDVNFSLSDTTWIFLHGQHVLNQTSKLEIVRARNVTLKKEEKCATGCRLVLRYPPLPWMKKLYKAGSQIIVMESNNIVFEELTVQTNISVVRTSNLFVRFVEFQNATLSIKDPIGNYTLLKSIFGPSSNAAIALTACHYATSPGVNCSFSFTFESCMKWELEPKKSFMDDTKIAELNIRLTGARQYRSIHIIVANSTFSNSEMSVDVHDYPIRTFTMVATNVSFSKVGLTMLLVGKSVAHPEPLDKWLAAHVVITACNFAEAEVKMKLNFLRSSSGSLGSIVVKHPEIVISHTKFHCLNGSYHPSIVFISIFDNDMHRLHGTSHGKLLTIQNNTIIGLYASALIIHNSQGHRVVLDGDNRIASNQGYGLELDNSQIELRGYNEISKNGNGVGGGVYMSLDSQLLLAPGTLLNVSANRGTPYGGGIYVDGETMELTEFVDCYIEKLTCPGWCFFQFINSDGQYVNASDIAEHNATVILSNNTATLGGNNVFNGHFQNCSLQTSKGTLSASKELILTVFHQYPPMDEEVLPSYPYFICLCDGDELNCIRNHTLVIDTYPVQQFPIAACAIGDWQQMLPVAFTVVSEDRSNREHLDITGCAEVYTLEHPVPGSAHHLSLEALVSADSILIRNLIINVSNCSSGLVYKQSSCVCNVFLMQHKFTCTMTTNTTTYRTELSHYWIGINGRHLLLSPNCPASYCDSDVLLNGLQLTLDENTQNKQCTNDRHGLLCSECPSGYSSVFGSFKCKRCSSVWLLQLPLYALGGVFIVALLFLFNLTLLQGTIMGVVLYTNIMGFMQGFLQEHSWGPLFFLLSVLNLQSGAGLCFYDGMDQFAKALLQFAFPFYLFTLLIVIIIVTHKCGYRMFRKARFIARRAVPVLATIMVLTYTSLVSAVIVPLRYTTLYDADTAQGETVWLYQPSLPFFGGQHLVIGILSIAVTVLYLIPFTFTMLFGDLMRRYFHKLWFSHFMDVLHGGFRWPLGFWIGLRLLLRVILVVINISTNPNTHAFCTLVTAGTLLVVQLLVKPFRDPNQFREDIHLQGPPSCKRKCLTSIKKFFNAYHAPLFDTLYLLNIIQMSAIAFGSNSQTEMLSVAVVNILILLALVQFAVILVYHAYNFFPVPERARSCAQSCWSTMRAIPSMLKDTQCCRRGPREEEEPRRSPIPLLILRPPEIDESYDSETETSSYSDQLPPEEAGRRESTPEDPLLACGN